MKTVLYSVSLGYFARNLLRTGVLERLLENGDIRIVILSPAYDDDGFRSEFSFSDRIVVENLHDVDIRANIFDKILWKMWLMSGNNRFFKRSFLFMIPFRFVGLTWKGIYENIFEKYHPNLVITGTPGFNSKRDIPVIQEAKRKGVKTLCLVHSWDNIGGYKGFLPTRPDLFGVWNELQKREAVDLHFYPEEDVMVVGPPNFDLYQKRETFIERNEFFKKMGLDPKKRLITVATASRIATKNDFILDILLKAVKEDNFIEPVQILCRVHPRDRKEDYQKYLDNTNLVMDFPGKYLQSIGWNPDKREMIHLANTLKHSDIIVNVASTITIEAAILDRPVINMGFSLTDPEEFEYKIKRRAWNMHFKYVLDTNCSYIAKNPEDLVNAINGYLTDPSIHREGRRKLAQSLCYKLDGKAADRIASLILSLIRQEDLGGSLEIL